MVKNDHRASEGVGSEGIPFGFAQGRLSTSRIDRCRDPSAALRMTEATWGAGRWGKPRRARLRHGRGIRCRSRWIRPEFGRSCVRGYAVLLRDECRGLQETRASGG